MARLAAEQRQVRRRPAAWSRAGERAPVERRPRPRRPGRRARLPLQWLSRATIDHYERHAAEYLRFTFDHDIGASRAAFLGALDAAGGRRILDLGCGVGRDLRAFRDRGYDAIGLDGSAAMAEVARRVSGCEVWRQDFLSLDLPQGAFDGIFANASLFHVPPHLLPDVLAALARALRPGGVLFTANPLGGGEEGWLGERYVCLHSERGWCRLARRAGFVRIGLFRRPPGLPRRRQTWLATLWRRI